MVSAKFVIISTVDWSQMNLRIWESRRNWITPPKLSLNMKLISCSSTVCDMGPTPLHFVNPAPWCQLNTVHSRGHTKLIHTHLLSKCYMLRLLVTPRTTMTLSCRWEMLLIISLWSQVNFVPGTYCEEAAVSHLSREGTVHFVKLE